LAIGLNKGAQFVRRTLTGKVLVGSLVYVLFILGAAAFGLTNLLTLAPLTTQLSDRMTAEIDLNGEYHLDLMRAVAATKSFALAHDNEDVVQAHSALGAAQAVSSKLEELESANTGMVGGASQHELQQLQQDRQALLITISALISAVETHGEEDASPIVDALEQQERQLVQLEQTADQLVARDNAAATTSVHMAIQRGILSVIIGFGLVVALIVLALVLLHWRIVGPLKTLAVTTRTLSSGAADQLVQVTSQDEIGDLQTAFNQMTGLIRAQTSELERQVMAANAARDEAEQGRIQIADQLAQIEAQHAVIREMSVPVLPLTPTTLVLPLVGVLDADRLRLLQEQALHAIEHWSARHLLVDVTGIPVVDTQVAHGLVAVVQAARLLGAETIIVGIRPEVAQALIGLGVHLDEMVTRSSLQSGIAYTFAQRRSA
jgi:rsbT co-antagonist protein RsbR